MEAEWLLSTRLRLLAERITSAAGPAEADAAWREAEEAVRAAGASEDATVALPVLLHDVAELATLFEGWRSRRVPLPAWDQAVLKRAMNAYKKRLKLTRADDEITSSRNPLSRGATSHILGVRPPEQYPQDVWDLLVAQGRLHDAGHGLLEPAAHAPAE